MDTELRRYKTSKIKKAVAFILAMLCVAMLTGRFCEFVMLEDELNISENFDSAFRALISDRQTDLEVEKDVVTRSYENYARAVGEIIMNYGGGTKEDYEKLVDTVNLNNQKAYDFYKQNLINYISGGYGSEDDIITILFSRDITVLESLYRPDYDLSGYSEYWEGDFYNYDNYNYLNTTYADNYNNKSQTLASQATMEYDGVFYISNCKFNFDNGEVLQLNGYYSFKVNDAVFQDNLYKYSRLYDISSMVSYESFKEDYNKKLTNFEENYKNGYYFIRNKDGRVFTNTNILKDISDKDITENIKQYGFYVRQAEGRYTSNYGERVLSRCSPKEILRGVSYFVETNGDIVGLYRINEVAHYSDEGVISTTLLPTTSAPMTTTLPSVSSSGDNTDTSVTTVTQQIDTNNATISGTTPKLELSENPFVPLNDETDIYFFVDTSFNAGTDTFSIDQRSLYKAKDFIIETAVICVISVITLILCFAYLIMFAGRRKNESGLWPLYGDGMFVDLRIVIDVASIALLIYIGFIIVMESSKMTDHIATVLSLGMAACLAILLDLILFCVRHIKNKTLFKRISIIWVIKVIVNKVRKFFYDLGEKLGFIRDVSISMLVKGTIFFVANGIAIFASVFIGQVMDNWLFFWLIPIADIICFIFFIRYLYQLKVILKNIKLLRQGNFNVVIDLEEMPPSLRAYAEDIINLRNGLENAVSDAVRQEQTKTELITNVSHDLKTPLTSIINYVDLLKKCEISDESAKEYLDILGEKSDRLKKLIEDLVEASKASTGNIRVELMNVSLNEMINQLLGEHADSLEKKRLSLICETPEEEILLKADGKLLYRVLENLIVNVEKYSLYGTRVYLKVNVEGNMGTVTFKNISENPLNISVDRLKERFVRGDEARTTEGNGLGLSIAESLCNVQGGRLDISINGDLFIAKVSLPMSF